MFPRRPIALALTLTLVATASYAAEPVSDLKTLDTVIVSVQKRPELAKDVPRSMTVLGQSKLEQTRTKTVDGLAALGPNLSSSQANGVNVFSMRGLGGGGRNIGFDPRVGVYLDGMYIGQGPALGQPLFGLEQIVILRGPQGHLFGRNSVAGAINMTTRAPSDNFGGEVAAAVGSNGLREGSVMLGGPLSERVSAQVGVGYEHRDGITYNRATGQDLDETNRYAGRAQLRVKLREDEHLDLYVDRSKVRESSILGEPVSSFFGLPIPGGILPPREVSFNTKPENNIDMSGASLNWSMKDGGGRTWEVVAGHRSTDQLRINDVDFSAADLVSLRYADQFKLSSVEGRVATDATKRSRFILGTYLSDETATSQRGAYVGQDMASRIPVPNVPVLIPFGLAFAVPPAGGAQTQGRVDTQSAAVFGTWDFSLTDRWTTHVGGRYSRDRKEAQFSLDGSRSGKLQIATINNFHDRRTSTHFSPMVGASYAVNSQTKAYATYSTGYKSGGWNLDLLNRAQAVDGFDFDDENIKSFEVGMKGRTLGNRLSYDLAVFQSQMSDYQVFMFVPLGNGGSIMQLRNAASARSRGVDMQGQFKVNSHVEVGGYVGLLDARFTSFPKGGTNGADLSGNRLPEAPRATAGLNAAVKWNAFGDGQFALRGEHRFRSTSYTVSENLPSQTLGARHVTDVRLDYRPANGAWSAGVFVENLFNEDADVYRNRDFFGHEIHKRMDPRSVGVEMKYNF